LIWSARAVADLDAACEYIARDSARYAYLFAQRIVAKIETIPQHPRLGAVVPEYGREDLRERLFQNYRIIYRIRGDAVEIVAVIHAARLLPSTPPA
jgi:plasmid stabilization system protein ParE